MALTLTPTSFLRFGRHAIPAHVPTITPASCELCDGDRFVLLARFDRKQQPLDTVVCQQCGLVSHAKIPTDRELERYYEQQYRQDYHGEYAPSAKRVTREWERCANFANKLKPLFQKTDRILEVGSGIGCTVKYLELSGYRVEGIEPGEGFCHFSTNVLHANVKQCWLDDIPQAPEFDFVILAHVLEHLNSPKNALTHIWHLLKDNGRLYVEVPNFGCPQSAPGKIFHDAHIFNYTPATLRMLGNATGFEVEQLTKPKDKNLGVLMRKRKSLEFEIDPTSFERSRRALIRYNTLTYHLRWSYFTDSAHRWGAKIRCLFGTQRKLDTILRNVNEHPPRSS